MTLSLSRRALLSAAGSAITAAAATGVISAPFVLRHRAAWAAEPLRLSWNASAICNVAIPVAIRDGIFEKHGITIDLNNYSGSTDQLLEALATGKSDAAVGMALRWLKPLEQGFDVKITSGIHGGCMRLLAGPASGIRTFEDLRGKTIGVSDMASPSKNFFSIVLHKRGIDPLRDVEWRQFPADLLVTAIDKKEAHALAEGDPLSYGFIKNHGLVEVGNNLSAEYHDRTCCVIGVRGSLLRERPAAAAAVNRALIEAQHIAAHNPRSAAEAFAPYVPKYPVEDLAAMLSSHAHHLTPTGNELRHQLALYGEELKLISVFKPKTDIQAYVKSITADVV